MFMNKLIMNAIMPG